MENILMIFVVILGTIVGASIFNEKKLHIPHDIALVLITFFIGVGVLAIQKLNLFGVNTWLNTYNIFQDIHLDHFLLECVLGFIVFAGASKLHLKKFMNNFLPIGYLVTIASLASSFLYGSLFYGVTYLLGLDINIWVCILLGGILSTTDALPVVSVLKKAGVSKSVTAVLEGESLLNDRNYGGYFCVCYRMVKKRHYAEFLFYYVTRIYWCYCGRSGSSIFNV